MTTTIRILDALNDAQEWHDALARLPKTMQDIYFFPEYVALEENPRTGTQAKCFVFENTNILWVYPFLLRRIRLAEETMRLEDPWYDIETPHGYGGPLVKITDTGNLTKACAAFDAWCQDNRVVAEFVRLHPLLDVKQGLSQKASILDDRPTFSLDIERIQTEGLAILPSKTRNMIRKARKLGVKIEAADPEKHFNRFMRMYKTDMKRKSADDFYLFSEQYFERLRDVTREHGTLLFAVHKGQDIATGIFLRGKRLTHYHLSASATEHLVPGTVNLLIYEAAFADARRGLVRMHLGGGRTAVPEDSLTSFKKKNASDEHIFRIAKRVHHKKMYTCLSDAWAQQHPGNDPADQKKLLFYH